MKTSTAGAKMNPSPVQSEEQNVNTKRIITGMAAAALLFAGAGLQAAVIFENVYDTTTIQYGGNIGQTDVDGLTGETKFTLTEIGIDHKSFTFDVEVENTTDDAIWADSRISRFGFDVDPTVTGVSASSPWFADLGGSFPNQVGSIDICVQGESQGDCAGGPGGPLIGQTQSLSLTLSFSTRTTSVELSNFAVRYQSLTSLEDGIYNTSYDDASGTGRPTNGNGGGGGEGNGNEIPEPATLALFGGGLLGLGWMMRRRNRVDHIG